MTKTRDLEITVCDMPEQPIAYVRHRGAYQPHDKALFQGMFAKLLAWAVPRELFHPPQTRAMTVYSSGHPDSSEPQDLCVDACISVGSETRVDGDIGKRVLPGGKYAKLVLQDASMEECEQAWQRLFNHWLPQSGYQPGDGAYYCEHLNDPAQHPQNLHHVAMYLPVKPL